MSKLYDCIKKYAENNSKNISFTYRVGEEYKNINYGQLKEYVDGISGFLSEYKNKTIAIIGNNKIEYAISFLAVVCNIGNAFLIDKELGKEDIEKVFAKCKPDLIILDDDINLSFDDAKIILFSEISEKMISHISFEYDNTFSGNLLLHTSGTTGEVKCVLLNEKKYFSVIKELNDKWDDGSIKSCLLIIPLYHVYALVALFHSIYAGINSILEWDFKRITDVFKETKPHIFMGVPLIYNKIRGSIFEKNEKKVKMAISISNVLLKLGIDVRKKLFKEIHEFFGGNYIFGCSAGTMLPYDTSKFFYDIGLPIYNVYGMTETAGPMAISYLNHNDFNAVGEILDINDIKIIDQNDENIGSIMVKGINVFDGYLNDDNSCIHDGYFDTGDLGYVKNTFIYVVGRKKNILIGENGINISPNELRELVLKNSMIHECSITMENNRLIALVYSDMPDEELDKYIEKLNRKLPKYKRIYSIRNTSKKIK